MEWAPEMLIELMRGHSMSELTSDIPADLAIIDIRIDYSRSHAPVLLTVESTSFDDVPWGGVLPIWNPTYTLRRSELEAIFDLVRSDP